MKKIIVVALKMFLVMTLLTGVLYPLLVTGFAETAFRHKARGSLVYKGDTLVGSELIGQGFKDPRYFWPRPSACQYGTMPSSGSNLGPTSDSLKRLIQARQTSFISANGLKTGQPVPVDMLTASGSGLDPDITVQSALLQVERIVRARGMTNIQRGEVVELIDQLQAKPQLFVFGGARINVLWLNLNLDQIP